MLDELEGIAHDPSILPDAAPGNNVTYRFKRTAAGTSHFLTLALWRDDGSRLLTVLGITRRTVLPPP